MCFYRKQLRKLDTLPGTGYTKKRKKIKGFLLESKRFFRNADGFSAKAQKLLALREQKTSGYLSIDKKHCFSQSMKMFLLY